MARRAAAVSLAAVAAAGGCGGDRPPPDLPPPAIGGGGAGARAGVAREDVPAACRRSVPAAPRPTPATLLGPPVPVAVARVSEDGAVSRIEGYAASVPGRFVAAWLERPDVTVGFSENEGFDAEISLQGGSTQVFWKLRRVCDEGSTFQAVVTTGG